MLLTQYLMIKAAEEAAEGAVAFSKAADFGLDSIDEKENKPQRQVIAYEVNDVLTFVKLLKEEGVVIEGIGEQADLDTWRTRLAKEVLAAAGADPKPDDMECILLVLGAARAALVTKAFTKALTFGIDSVDPQTNLTSSAKIATMINALIVVIRLLVEEGVEIPGIGDEEYMVNRYEKAVQGAEIAHGRGIITDLGITAESFDNGGVDQTTPTIVGADEAGDVTQETVDDIDRIKAIAYDPPSGGDAAPNGDVEIVQ
jgi:hypothetical protein